MSFRSGAEAGMCQSQGNITRFNREVVAMGSGEHSTELSFFGGAGKDFTKSNLFE